MKLKMTPMITFECDAHPDIVKGYGFLLYVTETINSLLRVSKTGRLQKFNGEVYRNFRYTGEVWFTDIENFYYADFEKGKLVRVELSKRLEAVPDEVDCV